MTACPFLFLFFFLLDFNFKHFLSGELLGKKKKKKRNLWAAEKGAPYQQQQQQL
jgi:hypothetical protein